MSDSPHYDFSKFVPGFDFLQSLSQGKSAPPQGPASWIAPTLDPKELDKRIEELKAVQFWLDQNATALKATIQALEVQKMTLATLKGMNMDVSAMSKAFQFPAAAPSAPTSTPAPTPAPPAAEMPKPAAKKTASTAKRASAAAPVVDPVQLWSSLTQQFQTIATNAMQEVSKQANKAAASAPKPSTANAAPAKTATKKSVKKPARRA